MNYIFSNPSFPIINSQKSTDSNLSNSLNDYPLNNDLIDVKNSEELFRWCFPKEDYKKEEEKL